MKIIRREDFAPLFEKALLEANFNLRSDIKNELIRLYKNEESETEKKIIDVFLKNADYSRDENRALCQDTGYVQTFIQLGREVYLDFSLEEEINRITEMVYQKNNLRKSLADPITRENTKTNTPVFIDVELTEGNILSIDILLKGGGSENVTQTGFLLPTASRKEITLWAAEQLKKVGSKACPPYLVGICLGGNLEKALYYSKKLLLNRIDSNNMNSNEKELSKEILEAINQLPIGFQGLKFGPTALCVQVKLLPCHIATLPAALSIGCNSVRQSSFKI